jgi:hypothetical protein
MNLAQWSIDNFDISVETDGSVDVNF